MAINKTLPEIFGDGATQTLTEITIPKGGLQSNRVPIAFEKLIALAENTGESIFAILLMMMWERQDTSADAEVAIFGPTVNLVNVVSDGKNAIADEYVFTVRILDIRTDADVMPNPNLI